MGALAKFVMAERQPRPVTTPAAAKAKEDKREAAVLVAADKLKAAAKAALAAAKNPAAMLEAVQLASLAVAVKDGAGSWRGLGLSTLRKQAIARLPELADILGLDQEDIAVLADLTAESWEAAASAAFEAAGLVKECSDKGTVYWTVPKSREALRPIDW